MTFLFIASIGPVQPFIASARRTRDLYVGSTLLSELSKAAAKEITSSARVQAQLIFPSPDPEGQLEPGTSFNVANKIVAIVHLSPEQMMTPDGPDSLGGLGDDVRNAIHRRLTAVKEEAFHERKDDLPPKVRLIDEEKANEQLAHLIEYSWVAVPFAQEKGDYENARKRAEAILGARKNTHFFHQVTWGGYGDKSSIDGQRECVIPSECYPNRRDVDRVAKIKQLYDMYKAGPQERLSAVDLVKRLGLKSIHETVFSTSHIAAIPFLESLEENVAKMSEGDKRDVKKLWRDYIKCIEQVELEISTPIIEYITEKLKNPYAVTGNADGALLFKERLLDDTEHRDKLVYANKALEDFFHFTDRHLNDLRPSPYYALLLADGDGMGKAIDKQAERGFAGHQAISRTLAAFAGQVRSIVNDTYHGSLVYAGGDDVLALLPLHTVLPCAKKLHDTFGIALNDFKDKDGNSPTLSVGIAVVHHLSLLLDSLELARDAERKAKGHTGKNALAVIVKKRGGEPNALDVSWNEEEERFALLVDLYIADVIPDGMAYELRTMMERLKVTFQHKKQDEHNKKQEQDGQEEKDPHSELQEIMQLEAARILRRKLYFSRERVKQPAFQDIEPILSKHLKLDEIPEAIRKGLKTPQDRARYLLLRQIHMQERPKSGFDILKSEDITGFVDALIVAQTFAAALKPTRTKGFAE